MKKYESIFIVDDQRAEEGGAALLKRAEALVVELGGDVVATTNMGQRQLAHPIRKRSTAVYWSLIFNLPEAKVSVFKDHYHLDEGVLRLTILIDKRPERISLKPPAPVEA